LASFGVAYGLYNVAWGAGLLGGPALGGFLLERLGFGALTLAWAPGVVMATLLVANVGTTPNPRRGPADVGLGPTPMNAATRAGSKCVPLHETMKVTVSSWLRDCR